MITDRRLLAANGRVADLSLKGMVEAERFVRPSPVRIIRPVVDLSLTPGGVRTRQLLFGQLVWVYEDHDGWSFVKGEDGYVGYVQSKSLGIRGEPTHRVATFATHAYAAPDLKSRMILSLPFGSRLAVQAVRSGFLETPDGFVPQSHVRPMSKSFDDLAGVAEMHLRVPYLWGGNSTRGIDCSGLVQAAAQACGVACPGDSDMQRDQLGSALSDHVSLRRGDLIFWDGHVGIMLDEGFLIHANAHAMATATEPLGIAALRIAKRGDGDILVRKRI